jgi:hypothetical protein
MLILLSDYLKLLLFVISNRDLLQHKMYTFCEVRTGPMVIKRQSFLISSHEVSEGDGIWGFRPYFDIRRN